MSWEKYNIGDKVRWSWNDVDGGGYMDGEVTEIHEDHVTVIAGGTRLWMDEDTEHMFSRI